MSLVIRELVVRATIAPKGEKDASAGAEESSGSKDNKKSEVIAECIDQVMDILARKEER